MKTIDRKKIKYHLGSGGLIFLRNNPKIFEVSLLAPIDLLLEAKSIILYFTYEQSGSFYHGFFIFSALMDLFFLEGCYQGQTKQFFWKITVC